MTKMMDYTKYGEIVARKCDPKSGKWVEIILDDSTNPLEEGMMAPWDLCMIPNYSGLSTTDFYGSVKSDEFDEAMKEVREKGGLVMRVFLLDHSGLSISLQPFNDPWDSGCGGYAILEKEDLVREYDDDPQKAIEALKAKVNLLDAASNGRVYGVACFDPNTESESTCWGFYSVPAFADALIAMAEWAEGEDPDFGPLIKECIFGEKDRLNIRTMACVPTDQD